MLWVRVAFLVLGFASGLGVVLYAAYWMVLPPDAAPVHDAPGLEAASREGRRPSRLRRLGDATPALVLAVLGRAGVSVGSADVFVSVAGGVRVDEPGADLAVALAIASAARGVTLGDGVKPLAAFGEIGLTG